MCHMEIMDGPLSTFEDCMHVSDGISLGVLNAGTDSDEDQVKQDTQATLRCFPFDSSASDGPCFLTGSADAKTAIFAKAY